MKAILLGIGKVLLVAAIAVVGLVGGAFAGGWYCTRFVVPGWVKQYPHDGQLGLGVMMYALGGAFLGLVLAVIGMVIVILRSYRDRQPLDEAEYPDSHDSPTQLHLN